VPPAALTSGVEFIAFDGRGWLAMCALSAVIIGISWAWTPRWAARHCPYRHRASAWVIQTAFAILTAGFLLVCFIWLASGTDVIAARHELSSVDNALLAVILVTFFLNGVTPYLGNKTEFSFAMFSNLRIEPWTHLLIPESWRIFRTPQYIEVHAIEGLPRQTEIAGNRPAELSLHVLSQCDKYRYSRYFFREALRALHMAVRPHPAIRVRYTELGRLREAQLSDLRTLGPCLQVTRFPFVMPKDPEARHSEQGALPGNSTERQLF
jgi:hypothetical protein